MESLLDRGENNVQCFSRKKSSHRAQIISADRYQSLLETICQENCEFSMWRPVECGQGEPRSFHHGFRSVASVLCKCKWQVA